MKISLVVPCYNEEKNIELLTEAFARLNQRYDVELVLVDNGSTDGTGISIKRQLEKYKFISTVRIEDNIGYGFGILTGLRQAKGDYIGWMHADMQVTPMILSEFIDRIGQAPQSDIYYKGKRRKCPVLDSIFYIWNGNI